MLYCANITILNFLEFLYWHTIDLILFFIQERHFKLVLICLMFQLWFFSFCSFLTFFKGNDKGDAQEDHFSFFFPSHFVWTNHCMNKADLFVHCQALNNEIALKRVFPFKRQWYLQ